MILLLQRVTQGAVEVAGERIARIGRGIVVLVGFERDDDTPELTRLCNRLLAYRLFADQQGRMNRSVQDIDGDILLVPQFTLTADTNSGNRPSFTPAATPQRGQELFDQFATQLKDRWPKLALGRFGADMRVTIINDGPVTFWLQQRARTASSSD